MSDIRVFIDFGSTFTKAAAFDLESETLLARVQSPSTVDTDVTEGLLAALEELKKRSPVGEHEILKATACSSATGGLRLAVIGLVPDYTTKAGYLAALGAGAKVVGSFSYELTNAELHELEAARPDIVLLTGGTDGGNRRAIVRNANALASSSVRNIIVAGNKSARDDVEAAFEGSGKTVT
ncbi:MAG: glutamate mutase L, partial [Oscillospiraceae bacterium]|nr:glutamate mutase L [Oscillospiraceae bacterium]